MQRKRRQGLIALNVTLLVLLTLVTVAPLAQGQRQPSQQAPNRARGEYSMVGGDITGGSPNAVYIIDANNSEMIAVRYNNSRRSIEGIGYRDLSADSASQNPGGPR